MSAAVAGSELIERGAGARPEHPDPATRSNLPWIGRSGDGRPGARRERSKRSLRVLGRTPGPPIRAKNG